jgi:antitoxin CptB
LPVAAPWPSGVVMSSPNPGPELSPRLARLRFRAWHRGTREADYMIGCYFDRFVAGGSNDDVEWFETLIEEEDHDILGWALKTISVPEQFAGARMERMQQLDYVDIPR